MRKCIYNMCAASALAIMAVGCAKEREFTVEGQLDGKVPDKISLERMNENAQWIEVEQIDVDKNGGFTVSFGAPEYPQLFRINAGGKYVYLPVDSTENFTLKANGADISRGFTLSGSPQAEAMTAFEAEALKVQTYNNQDSIDSFKRRVYDNYLKDARGNIFSYYVLTRQMGDGYLIEYSDPIYTAVATSFKTYKPDDPHTPLLAEQALKGQREQNRRKGKQRVVEAEQTAMIEINLPAINDKNVALSSLLGKGKPVVVAFGGMTIPDAFVINVELRKLFEAGKADIYQVCVADASRFDWEQQAKALPWTVVWDKEGLQSTAAMQYNIASVPAFFIYNAQGELVSSTGDVKKVASMI